MMITDTPFARESIRPAGYSMSLVPFRDATRREPHGPLLSSDAQFVQMDRAFARCGGWTSGDEVARLLRRRYEQPVSLLARWIVTRRVVSFDWHGQTLVPLFQFDLNDMSLRMSVLEVVAELAETLDELELALWFATPNEWLHDATPVEMIGIDQPAVLRAARAGDLAPLA